MKRTLLFLLPFAFVACKQQLSPTQEKAEEVRLKIKKAGIRFERAYGCKIKGLVPDTANSALASVTEYDENGLALSTMTIYSPGNSENNTEKYTYNSKGQLVETRLQWQSGSTVTIKNEYNSKGWNSVRTFYDKDNELDRRITYEYDKLGNISSMTSAEANGTIGYRMEYTYNDRGDEASSRQINGQGGEQYNSKIVTRTDNLRVTDVFEGGRKSFTMKETLNKAGLVTVLEQLDGVRDSRTEYTYNTDGFVTEVRVLYADSTGYLSRVKRSKD